MGCHWVEKTLPDPLAGKLMATGDPSGLKTQSNIQTAQHPFTDTSSMPGPCWILGSQIQSWASQSTWEPG